MTGPASRAAPRCDHVLFAGRAASGRLPVTRGGHAEPHVAGGALGADYRLARIAAGACEALYMYAAMRWLVFRDVHVRDRPRRRISRPR